MNHDITILVTTAATIGFLHTLLGPDHYLPFIMIGKARNWKLPKTLWITFLCGIGHVGSSVLLGLIGIAAGIAVSRLEIFESFRGSLAAWALISFGLIYMVYGIRKAIKNKPHLHKQPDNKKVTPWILFIIFILGPCEPLIPILMYPAVKVSVPGMIAVTLTFALTTILTMMAVVFITSQGLKTVVLKKLERYSHALAGAVIMLSGLGIQLLGL